MWIRDSASAVLIDERFAPTQPCSTTLIRVANPYETLSQLMRLYVSQQEPHWTGVHPTAIVDPSVEIPKECIIGPYACIEADVKLGEQVVISAHCVIGGNCSIGDHTTLHPRVTLYSDSVIGHHCRIKGVDAYTVAYFRLVTQPCSKILEAIDIVKGDLGIL